nr:hypothetical protein [Fredinandcohnia onubensis]
MRSHSNESEADISIPIPHCYLKMTEGLNERGKLFKGYVQGYINKSYPELEINKIEGMEAICKRK